MKTFVNYDWAGELKSIGARIQFSYQPACKPEQAVSLVMPVGSEPYETKDYGAMLPVFDMNIPEGYLYEKLKEIFSKLLPVVDRFTMLEMVGRSQIGRIRVAPSLADIQNVPARSLKEMLVSGGTAELFADLLKHYARYSGVAGAQPKVLARDSGTLESMTRTGLHSPSTISGAAPPRITSPGTTHIVKMFDPAVFPALATNEFLCLQAAKRAGLPAPAVWLSNNRQCLVVERFDIKPDGTYLAFEDVCALRLRQSAEKYLGTYENVAQTLLKHVEPIWTREDLRRLFEMIALTCCLRNGDAHLKNFGVLYETPANVRLSPAYDIITTTVYQPKDMLALALGGTQQWPSRKKLLRFGTEHCGLTRPEARDSLAKIIDAVQTVRNEIPAHIADTATQPARDALARMTAAWQTGIASLSHDDNRL